MCGLIDLVVGSSGLLWVMSWVEAMSCAMWPWITGC